MSDEKELDEILGLPKPHTLSGNMSANARAELEAYNRTIRESNAKKRKALVQLFQQHTDRAVLDEYTNFKGVWNPDCQGCKHNNAMMGERIAALTKQGEKE